MKKPKPFCYFKTSPEIIRLTVMLYIRFSLSLRNVEDLLHERGVDICHEAIGFWWIAAPILRLPSRAMPSPTGRAGCENHPTNFRNAIMICRISGHVAITAGVTVLPGQIICVRTLATILN
jgi:hypothetical protein